MTARGSTRLFGCIAPVLLLFGCGRPTALPQGAPFFSQSTGTPVTQRDLEIFEGGQIRVAYRGQQSSSALTSSDWAEAQTTFLAPAFLAALDSGPCDNSMTDFSNVMTVYLDGGAHSADMSSCLIGTPSAALSTANTLSHTLAVKYGPPDAGLY